MKKTIILAVALVSLLGIGTIGYNYYMKQVEETKVSLPEAKKEVAEEEVKTAEELNFDLLQFAGGSKELKDFYGDKPIVLNFWASTCPPCIQEMPIFQKQYEIYGDELTFLMVNVPDFNGESELSARNFLKENNYTFPAYFEVEYSGSENFDVNSIPQTFYLSPEGKILDSHIGAITESQLVDSLDNLKEN